MDLHFVDAVCFSVVLHLLVIMFALLRPLYVLFLIQDDEATMEEEERLATADADDPAVEVSN